MDDISGNPCDRERTLNCFVFTEEGKTLASINHPLAGLFGAESLFIVEISSLLSQEQSEELTPIGSRRTRIMAGLAGSSI